VLQTAVKPRLFAAAVHPPTRIRNNDKPTMSPAMPAFPRVHPIVFLCVENSCRSQMAEAFARRHGGPRVAAHSAGSRPSGRVNARAIEIMRERGFDLTQQRSKAVADLGEAEFDVAVTMGCGDECPALRAKQREDWKIPDPKDLPPDEFRRVRDLIEEKVQELLARLDRE
jgi:arsenate reductase (thioredoxin)